MRLFVLGASGGVGSNLLAEGIARGHQITAQTRTAGKIAQNPSVKVVVGSPTDAVFLRRSLEEHDAAILCIGVDTVGRTTLFSDAARALIAAMQAAKVKRLVAITGVGSGETRGHGGWFYNRVIFPLFTRNRYADKDRQEALIQRSELDWTIIRPAPFTAHASAGPLRIVTDIPPDLQLRSINRAEVATFILDILENGQFIHQKPFIGHL